MPTPINAFCPYCFQRRIRPCCKPASASIVRADLRDTAKTATNDSALTVHQFMKNNVSHTFRRLNQSPLNEIVPAHHPNARDFEPSRDAG
jgi:hypothetical protein